MKRLTKNSVYVLILLMGIALTAFFALKNDNTPKNVVPDYSVVPAAYAEHRMLSEPADTLNMASGTVILPSEDKITLHGTMTGGMPEFMKFLEERKPGLNYIYKKFQKLRPGFEGSITFDITIDVCGDVYSMAEIASTTNFPRFNVEIKNSLSRQKFPKTVQGHYTLSFTLAFSKDEPKEGDKTPKTGEKH